MFGLINDSVLSFDSTLMNDLCPWSRQELILGHSRAVGSAGGGFEPLLEEPTTLNGTSFFGYTNSSISSPLNSLLRLGTPPQQMETNRNRTNEPPNSINTNNESSSPVAMVLSWKTYNRIAFYLNGIVTLMVCVGGIAGSGYSLCVIGKKIPIRKSMEINLKMLAIWDGVLLLTTICYYSLTTIVINYDVPVFSILPVIFHGPAAVTMVGSIWTMVFITWERQRAITSPLAHRISDDNRRTVGITLAIFIGAVLFCIPSFFELTIFSCRTLSGNRVHFVTGTEFRKTQIYKVVYRVILSLIFTSFGPFVAILWLSITMISEVCRPSHLRETVAISSINDYASTKKRRKSEITITTMLLGLTTKFLLTHSLPTFLNVWETHFMDKHIESPLFSLITELSNFLVVVNAATDWMVYCKSWKRRPTTATAINNKKKNEAAAAAIRRHKQKHLAAAAAARRGHDDLMSTSSATAADFSSPSFFNSFSSVMTTFLRNFRYFIRRRRAGSSGGGGEDQSRICRPRGSRSRGSTMRMAKQFTTSSIHSRKYILQPPQPQPAQTFTSSSPHHHYPPHHYFNHRWASASPQRHHHLNHYQSKPQHQQQWPYNSYGAPPDLTNRRFQHHYYGQQQTAASAAVASPYNKSPYHRRHCGTAAVTPHRPKLHHRLPLATSGNKAPATATTPLTTNSPNNLNQASTNNNSNNNDNNCPKMSSAAAAAAAFACSPCTINNNDKNKRSSNRLSTIGLVTDSNITIEPTSSSTGATVSFAAPPSPPSFVGYFTESEGRILRQTWPLIRGGGKSSWSPPSQLLLEDDTNNSSSSSSSSSSGGGDGGDGDGMIGEHIIFSMLLTDPLLCFHFNLDPVNMLEGSLFSHRLRTQGAMITKLLARVVETAGIGLSREGGTRDYLERVNRLHVFMGIRIERGVWTQFTNVMHRQVKNVIQDEGTRGVWNKLTQFIVRSMRSEF